MFQFFGVSEFQFFTGIMKKLLEADVIPRCALSKVINRSVISEERSDEESAFARRR
jgi:hypothetical protein